MMFFSDVDILKFDAVRVSHGSFPILFGSLLNNGQNLISLSLYLSPSLSIFPFFLSLSLTLTIYLSTSFLSLTFSLSFYLLVTTI